MANFSLFTLFVALRLFLLAAAAPTASPEGQAVAADSTWWFSSITRQGTVAYSGATDFKVFRNVKDYGAVGDGITSYPKKNYSVANGSIQVPPMTPQLSTLQSPMAPGVAKVVILPPSPQPSSTVSIPALYKCNLFVDIVSSN